MMTVESGLAGGRGARSAPVVVLSLITLCTIGIGQPLLDLLGRNVAFVVAHGLGGIGLVVLAVGLTLLIPAGLAAVVLLIRALHPAAADLLHDVLIGVLTAVAAMFVLRVGGIGSRLPVAAEVALVVLVAIAAAVAFHRSATVRRLATFGAIAAPAVVLLFLLGTPVRGLLFPPAEQTRASALGADSPPVVVVIFDELPLATLLDTDHTIDEEVFPAFARLAQDATFFRNATASHSSTVEAVPALLSGRYTRVNTPPVGSAHPTNLFALLGDTYRLHALEPLTDLCTGDGCDGEAAGDEFDVAALVHDLGVLQLHLVVPEELASRLPPVDAAWRDFGGQTAELDREGFLVEARGVLREDTPGAFAEFTGGIRDTGRPTLHVLHTLLPHRPWRYLPDGARHGGGGEPSLREEAWTDRQWPMAQSYQLHLAQTRLADRLLGELLQHLRDTGLYDRSALVVVADHGLSLLPGTPPRDITAESLPQIAPVPLFVKGPGQGQGRVSDVAVETIDVAPTVLDLLGAPAPEGLPGRSALGADAGRQERTLIDAEGLPWNLDASQDALFDAVARKFRLFPQGGADLYELTPPGYRHLLGTRPPPSSNTARGLSVTLPQAAAYDSVDPSGSVVPALVTGTVRGLPRGARPPALAIALNGTVQAVTVAEAGFGPPGPFRALVPPTAFRAGPNDLDVLLVGPGGRLTEIPRSG